MTHRMFGISSSFSESVLSPSPKRETDAGTSGLPKCQVPSYPSLMTSPPRSWTSPVGSSTPRSVSSIPLPLGGSIIADIDQAVSDAAKNLDVLRRQQTMMYHNFGASLPSSILQMSNDHGSDHLSREADIYRTKGTVTRQATCTWSGLLPPKDMKDIKMPTFSTKLFIGGVPWEMSEQYLGQLFSKLDPLVQVEWPRSSSRDIVINKGFYYIVFSEERRLFHLLFQCSRRAGDNDDCYYLSLFGKDVQVVPWLLSDSTYSFSSTSQPDPKLTVFVGAIHGRMTAPGLAKVFNDLFSSVTYCQLDTDKYNYPTGSGKVSFSSKEAYNRAVTAAFVEIRTPAFRKVVQVDPYLEDTVCSLCGVKDGPYFCRDSTCFTYFCHYCWSQHHLSSGRQHVPLMKRRGMRNSKFLG